MTIQPISSLDAYSGASAAHSAPKATSSQPIQDTVQLSAQAQASLDADHDGDSH